MDRNKSVAEVEFEDVKLEYLKMMSDDSVDFNIRRTFVKGNQITERVRQSSIAKSELNRFFDD